MPIYEFKCEKCGDFETLVFVGEEVTCPKCGGNVHRIMSACSFKSAAGDFRTAGSASGSSCAGCASTSCSTCH